MEPPIKKKNSRQALDAIRPSRVIIPTLLGLGVVAYLFYQEVHPEDFKLITLGWQSVFWLTMAIVLAGTRLFAYTWRIKFLIGPKLNWKKSFQIISLWEFASSVTPFLVGGTAVALFLLNKEKIKGGKITTVILFTILLDSLFFFIGTILFLFYFGKKLISPQFELQELDHLFQGGGWVIAFLLSFGAMVIYTLAIVFGLFVRPKTFKWLLVKATKVWPFRRWKSNAERTGDDIILASQGLKKQKLSFWLTGLLTTGLAWSSRFLVINCLILAVVSSADQFLIFGRQFVMYVILILFPSPGGSGAAEFAFLDFFIDMLPSDGIATALAAVWRLLTFYPFLVLGVLVLPQWLRRVYKKPAKP